MSWLAEALRDSYLLHRMSLPNQITVLGLNFILFIAWAFAAWKGDRLIRVGAIAYGMVWCATMAFTVIMADHRPPIWRESLWQALWSLIFLWLVLSGASRWFLVALIAQGTVGALWALETVMNEPVGSPLQFAVGLAGNMMAVAVALVWIGTTIETIRDRRRTVRSAEAAA